MLEKKEEKHRVSIDNSNSGKQSNPLRKSKNSLMLETIQADNVAKQECNIGNLIEILRSAFKIIDNEKDQNIVTCIGNTGSGKSTLMNSVVYGTESLSYQTQ